MSVLSLHLWQGVGPLWTPQLAQGRKLENREDHAMTSLSGRDFHLQCPWVLLFIAELESFSAAHGRAQVKVISTALVLSKWCSSGAVVQWSIHPNQPASGMVQPYSMCWVSPCLLHGLSHWRGDRARVAGHVQSLQSLDLQLDALSVT